MTDINQAIRRLSIQTTTSGVSEATRQLNDLARAQGGVAVSSAATERATLSADSAFQKLERRYQTASAQQAAFERTQRLVNAAVAQNPALAERASAVLAAAAERHNQFTTAANDNSNAMGRSAGLARHELINLSRQMQDVGVSLASGQSPFTVIAQQGSQIADVFATSQGTIGGFFKQTFGYLTSFLTLGRVAFAGVTGGVLAGVAALNSYATAQQKVQFALTGAGRASGATGQGIDDVARQGASTVGLSISEARELASALAATGKIGADALLPIVKIGKDIEHAFGVSGPEAAKMLAEAFSDPVKGAEQLNQRLGFLDASMQRQITNVVAQNRTWEAQKVLLAGVKSGLEGIDESVSGSTKLWTGLANGISDAWDRFGNFIARGLGGFQSLEQKIEQARKEIEQLRSGAATTPILPGGDLDFGTQGDSSAAIAEKTAQIEKWTAALQKNATAAATAQAAQKSLLQESTVRSLVPEIAQREQLNNQLRVLQDLMTSLGNDEAAGQRLKQIGLSFEMIAKAISVANASLNDFKTQFESALKSLQIANQAITAFSAGAKADIARQQSLLSTSNSGYTDDQRKVLAEQAYANSLKESRVALQEQARARELAANQAVAGAQIEIDLIGKSVGKQAELRANLQARQQLEQQLLQQHQQWGPQQDAELARVQKINAEYGKRVQEAGSKNLDSNIDFTRETLFFTETEKQIASILRQVHGDEWKNMMDGPQASAMRFNATMEQVLGLFKDVGQEVFKALLSGKNVMDALVGSLDRVASKLADQAFNDAIMGIATLDPMMLAKAGLEAGVSAALSAFTGDQKAQVELEEARKRWEGMASQVIEFNRAAAGFDVGPLTSELRRPSNDNEKKEDRNDRDERRQVA